MTPEATGQPVASDAREPVGPGLDAVPNAALGLGNAADESLSGETERRRAEPREAEPSPYRAVLDAIGAVAAPVSVVTALAYYIGVQRQTALARELGLEVSVLGLSTRDYVLRSTDTLVRFLAVLFVALFVVASVVAVVRRHVASRPASVRRWAALAAVAFGGPLLAYAVFGLFRPGDLDYLSLHEPIGLIAGGALSSLGLAALHGRCGRRRRLRGGWACAPFVVAGVGLGLLGLFWAANDYAQLQGQERGLDLQARVDDLLPQVTVYSQSPLYTTSDHVTEQALRSDGDRMYRYEGFRLLLRSGGKYFLLPVGPAGRQPVTVLPEEEIGWIEFTPEE